MIDTGRVAPHDVLLPDEALSEEEVAVARSAMGMWTAEHTYPVLPWACVVLTSVPDDGRAGLKPLL